MTIRNRVTRAAALAALSIPCLLAQGQRQLTVVRKVTLPEALNDDVAFGGLKEMSCDSAGNILAPVNRKYGSATRLVLRIEPDAKTTAQYPIDNVPEVKNGDIIEFTAEPNGDVHLLVRQVLKYSAADEPKSIGDTFVIRYDHGGHLIGRTRLAIHGSDFLPTGIAVLHNGGYLIVGRRYHAGFLQIVSQVFSESGTPGPKLDLNGAGTKPMLGKSVLATRVVRPAALKSNGSIYVLRGSSADPVYQLSDSGQLLKTISLKGPHFEFCDPHVLEETLVARRLPIGEEGWDTAEYVTFNLRTGDPLETLTIRAAGAGLACYRRDALTFMGDDPASPNSWAILSARP